LVKEPTAADLKMFAKQFWSLEKIILLLRRRW